MSTTPRTIISLAGLPTNPVAIGTDRLAELLAIEQEIVDLRADRDRLDWLADVNTKTGWVMLSRPIIEANMHSMRAAIDAAMKQIK